MSDIVHNDKNAANRPSTEGDKGAVNYYVIGLVIAAMAALLAYQIFGCADCYAPI